LDSKNHKIKLKWYTGSGFLISFSEILQKIKEYHNKNGSVFIGTDSSLKKKLAFLRQV
jgi:predicted RNase H-related nuclease YkuK (DUF458 family)